MKANAKRRKRKEEILTELQRQEEWKLHVKKLMDLEAEMVSRKLRIEDTPMIVQEHEKLLDYLKSEGIIDDKGNVPAK
jgi:hypothetical protein